MPRFLNVHIVIGRRAVYVLIKSSIISLFQWFICKDRRISYSIIHERAGLFIKDDRATVKCYFYKRADGQLLGLNVRRAF